MVGLGEFCLKIKLEVNICKKRNIGPSRFRAKLMYFGENQNFVCFEEYSWKSNPDFEENQLISNSKNIKEFRENEKQVGVAQKIENGGEKRRNGIVVEK